MWCAPSPWTELIAEDIHARARTGGPPYDPVEIAVAVGFEVRFFEDLGGPIGLLIRRCICVCSAAAGSIAMTVSHELAHAINNRWAVFPSEPAWVLERQMDETAAAILAPRRDLALAALRGDRLDTIVALFDSVPPVLLASRLLRFLSLDLLV